EPGEGALVLPGATFTVRVAASDATGVAAVALSATGAASHQETRPVAPPQASLEAVFEVAVPADAPAGAAIALGVAAVDAGGREATATRTVHVADVVP